MSGNGVSSFKKLGELHGLMFEVFTTRGLGLQHETRYGNSILGMNVALQPTEIKTTIGEGGTPKYVLPFPTQVFQVNYSFKTPELKFSLIHGRSTICTTNFKPVPPVSLGMRLVKISNKPVIPHVSALLKFPYATCEFQCQTQDYQVLNMVDLSMSFGTWYNALGIQVVRRIERPLAWAAMLHHRWEQGAAALSVLKDDAVMVCFRLKRMFGEYWQAAVNLQVDDKLLSSVTMGWKARIGRCQIHSAVNTFGELKTHFRVSLTPRCDFVLTEHLDHQSCAYRTGIALAWYAEPKPK